MSNWNNKEYVLAAIQSDANSFESASTDLKYHDKDIFIWAIEHGKL